MLLTGPAAAGLSATQHAHIIMLNCYSFIVHLYFFQPEILHVAPLMSYQMIVNELICFPVIYLLSIVVSTVTLHYCEAVMNLCHLILYNEFVLVGSLW